ncbi:hypothetical protein [Klebsiella aerogenes]|uniref:hypothetical protein n=1 Tax=Klebsiella aerogenes TaxID=548 RepID=UPI003A4DE3EE
MSNVEILYNNYLTAKESLIKHGSYLYTKNVNLLLDGMMKLMGDYSTEERFMVFEIVMLNTYFSPEDFYSMSMHTNFDEIYKFIEDEYSGSQIHLPEGEAKELAMIEEIFYHHEKDSTRVSMYQGAVEFEKTYGDSDTKYQALFEIFLERYGCESDSEVINHDKYLALWDGYSKAQCREISIT